MEGQPGFSLRIKPELSHWFNFSPLGWPFHFHQAFVFNLVLILGLIQWHKDLVSSGFWSFFVFVCFGLVKADFCIFHKNSFDSTTQIVFSFPTLIRILFYYTAHFLNLTLIKCILYFSITNNYLCSRFMVMYRGGWRLYQHFNFKYVSEVQGLSGKLIAAKNLAQPILPQTSLGLSSSSWLLFLEQLQGK